MKLLRRALAPLLFCVGVVPAAAAEAPAPPRASLLGLTVLPKPSLEPPADELRALVLLHPGTDEVDLEFQAVDGEAAAGEAARAAIPYLKGEGEAYRDAEGDFRMTGKAHHPGGDALVEVVVLVPHAALRLDPGQESIRYTASGRIGSDDVFFASSEPVPVPALRPVVMAEPAPAELSPEAQPSPQVSPAPPAPPKVMPAPQAPAKVAPAPMAPVEMLPAPMAPAGAPMLGLGPRSPFQSWKTRSINFATNRNVQALVGTPSQRFGDSVGDGVRYGSCEVNIPKERKPGELPLPKSGETADPSRHFLIVTDTVEFLDEAAFRLLIRGTDTGRDVLVYVHGFNTGFDFAVARMAQVVEDLEFSGLPVVFSWPAHAVDTPWPSDYTQDEANADHSYGALARVLKTLVEEQESRPADRRGKVHIIAHSLGNRVAMRAISILDTMLPAGSKPLGQVVLAAPDVSTAEFAQLQPSIERRSERVSLYFNPNDGALWASFAKHGRERRAGNSAQFLRGVDNIDAARANTDLLGHGYWAEASPVLMDLHLLITMGWEPARRVPKILRAFTSPKPYWAFPAQHSWWPFSSP